MPLAFLLDHHVPWALANGLRGRGIDVLTAQEDGSDRLPDPELLDRAFALKRILFSQDDDLLVEAARRQQLGVPFYGVIYIHQEKFVVAKCIDDLDLIASAGELADVLDKVHFLPL